MSHIVSPETLAELRRFATTSVANAIESFDVRLRNEGFADGTIQCRTPSLPPMVGFALTIRIRSDSPSWKGDNYIGRNDWWKKLDFAGGPHVMVIQDMDKDPGVGAFMGKVHSAILQTMGCVGAVTNGAVRGLPAAESRGFSLFAGSLSPSHAYIHVVEIGGVVEVGGLRVAPGDLLHGDLHGIVRIPLNVADGVPAAAAKIEEQEREILEYCKSPDFRPEELHSKVASNSGGFIARNEKHS